MKRKNYVNNKDLFDVMEQYYNACEKAKEENTDPPEIPNYIAECIILISKNLSTKGNFSGYSFKEDMIWDGVLNCIKYGVKNFKPYSTRKDGTVAKNNPFAYFTQIVKNAFVRKIELERNQQAIKIKNLNNLNIMDEVAGISGERLEMNEISNDFITNYEKRLTSKKKSAKVANTVKSFLA